MIPISPGWATRASSRGSPCRGTIPVAVYHNLSKICPKTISVRHLHVDPRSIDLPDADTNKSAIDVPRMCLGLAKKNLLKFVIKPPDNFDSTYLSIVWTSAYKTTRLHKINTEILWKSV